MIVKILFVLGILMLSFLLLIVYSCCVVSGRCSENERRKEYEEYRYK